MDGFTVTRRIRERHSGVHIEILFDYDEDALREGVDSPRNELRTQARSHRLMRYSRVAQLKTPSHCLISRRISVPSGLRDRTAGSGRLTGTLLVRQQPSGLAEQPRLTHV